MELKKIFIALVVFSLLIAGCNKPRRHPGRTYMPDMAYSRAYESYAALDSSKFTTSSEELGEGKIYYDATPVAGTRARGDLSNFYFESDSAGYNSSRSIKNPLPVLAAKDYLEAARLYQVNCAICHGAKLDGQGPLFTSGAYLAAPRNLMADDMKALPDGPMFHVITYGKGQMGSYASQLNTKQRWMIIHYIREKQAAGAAPAGAATDSTLAKPDTTTN